ncbi:hypothetical protein Poly30_19090 [Planctomycetes bacterium Poly30]|uniref:YchJ-like middle NTF2-like domain-containing protein n=2 Tax=Saltatorellus ferox TaxID=2528018 RepID=A0A518EQN7_9BACT|nr:hypothetical protein Poly30_19090 [Planctomycetes bacterium Poly30]
MNWPPNEECPCHSGTKYKRCCRPLHRGSAAETPAALMRSRFSAFACGLSRHVMDTTHPDGTAFEADRAAWERSIQTFSDGIEFAGLEILSSDIDGDEGHVSFRAMLLHAGKDASFTEHSRFLKEGGRWLYHSGTIE